MKRYQCIKNYRSDSMRHPTVDFKAGSISDFTVNPGGNFYGYRTTSGRMLWISSTDMRRHFQELLDLNVDDPYTDYEAQEYELLQPAGCARGAVWAIVITAAVVILYAIFG